MLTTSTRTTTNVIVWVEGRHEQTDAIVQQLYPDGMAAAIAEGLENHFDGPISIRTASIDEPEHGLSESALANADVVLWWGHKAHHEVSDEVVARVKRHVLGGMGLIVLHSGHWSKIFMSLMGTTCTLKWRNEADRELVWTVDPSHPITQGVPSPIVLPEQEMYGEFFDIPTPDELVFISSFSGGEVFRSGCTFRRGKGRIFFFSPGDQAYPVYFHSNVRQVLANAVRWARPDSRERDVPTLARFSEGWFESQVDA
ncbi:trehalose utilization protein ThuA [Microbacterium faecale]|uniref:Trehalose utilization protein ThuA n=1 Tax=Microbacterium faecale TaxID=1804630 RepID=A0A916Y1E7_9MICO|nr:ThuA domain-containing protein [Microbacterium faecale]GGD26729.1 trehalose utilization protein ThuA [Microbacterium faecale]